ncbi:MAG: ACP S-malonyltransferase [Proteobacteria bacterium]|nr:ACP S-malonyltransferase [Pseudomonadota bacterium]MCP4920376.1 ACP S-malonyltransferase [Pseudomonadota bacterium]
MRAFLLFPGRGSYQRDQLGSLQGPSAILDRLDAFRAGLGRPTLREMDGADRYSAKLHVAGENASILTFGAGLADLATVDRERTDIVCVGGNSMGWYTALAASGVLDLDAAATLVETMGSWQAGNVIGGQILYPTTDADWRPDPTLQATVDAALERDDVHLSIRLGGTAVLAGTTPAVRAMLAELPKVERGPRTFPLQLPLHSAFHTPLMQPTSDRAMEEIALPFAAPHTPLVDGRGQVFRSFSDPEDIEDWTLGDQVTATFDLTACVATALGDYAPDVVLLPGPGEAMGGPVAQVLIQLGWRGLRDRADFIEAQKSDQPVVISMSRPDQRARVT